MLPFELSFGLTVVDIVLLALTITTFILLVRLSRNLKRHRSLEHSTPTISSVAKAFREQAEKPKHIRELGEPSKKLEKINRVKAFEKKEPSPRSTENIVPYKLASEPEHTIHSITSSSAEPVRPHENVKISKESEKKITKPETSKKKASSHSTGCPHYFGYLTTVSDQGSVPDYCLRCPSIMRCLFATEEQITRAQA